MLTRGGPECLDILRFLIVIQATTFTFPSSKLQLSLFQVPSKLTTSTSSCNLFFFFNFSGNFELQWFNCLTSHFQLNLINFYNNFTSNSR